MLEHCKWITLFSQLHTFSLSLSCMLADTLFVSLVAVAQGSMNV